MLRALTWQVKIGQLVATRVITGLRALVRKNLIHGPEDEEIRVSGYELEVMAMASSGCNHWDVTAWEPGPGGCLVGIGGFHEGEPSAPAGGSGLAADRSRFSSEVMSARRRLGALSMWPSGCQTTAEIYAQAIEASMDYLWSNPGIKLSKPRPKDMFEWKLSVKVSKAQDGEGSSSDTCAAKNLTEDLPNGVWGPWKTVRIEIEALWIPLIAGHVHEQSLGKNSASSAVFLP